MKRGQSWLASHGALIEADRIPFLFGSQMVGGDMVGAAECWSVMTYLMNHISFIYVWHAAAIVQENVHTSSKPSIPRLLLQCFLAMKCWCACWCSCQMFPRTATGIRNIPLSPNNDSLDWKKPVELTISFDLKTHMVIYTCDQRKLRLGPTKENIASRSSSPLSSW